MNAWRVSPRRLLGGAVAGVLCAALMLSSLSIAGAAAGGKCAPGAEAKGCKLPDGARFYKQLPGNASITVQVGGRGVSVTAYAAAIKCTKFDPYLGDEQYVAVSLSGSRHPKVGRTYPLKKSETRRGEEGEEPESSLTEVTLDFKSAQLVVVKLRQLSEAGGKVSCDGGATWKLKRQS